MKKGKLLPMKIAGGVLLVLLLAVAGYVVYVFTAYYRVEDNQALEVTSMSGADRGTLRAGETYRVAS